MRLKRTYQTKLTTEDLYRNIGRNMSPEPGFSGSDFTYFHELNKAIETTESLWYSIPFEHKVKIRSQSVFYWPRAEVIFNPNDSGTTVTIKFIGSILAYIALGIFVTVFVGLMSHLVVENPSDQSPLVAILIVCIAMALVLIFFRRIQTNIIRRLQYS